VTQAVLVVPAMVVVTLATAMAIRLPVYGRLRLRQLSEDQLGGSALAAGGLTG